MTAQLTTTGRLRLKSVSVERLRLGTSLVLPAVLRYEARTQTGTLALTGTTPVRLFTVTPATGGATVTGRVGNILQDGERTPDQSDLSYTGYKPTLRNAPNIYLTTGTGSLITAGRVSVIDVDGARFPDTRDLTLMGYKPSVFSGQGRVPVVGALTFAGTTPAVGLTITPAVGGLTTAGIASTLRSDHNIVPNSGAHAVVGKTPSVIGAVTSITPFVGALGISGIAPTLVELGDSVTFDGANDWMVRQLSYTFTDTISVNTSSYNLRTAALADGWSGTIPLNATVTINSGVYVYSTTISTPAFASGSMPAGSTLALINNGYIMGMGGNGANTTTAGQSGGDAMDLDADLGATITNGSGYILGGGGGGGGYNSPSNSSYSGGGGGAGGGQGGNGKSLSTSAQTGGTGGGVGASGASGTFSTVGDDMAGSAGGGGRVFNGAGGARGEAGGTGGAETSNVAGTGGAGGGGGSAITNYVEDWALAGAGGGPGVAGASGSAVNAFTGEPSWGGGGGGWGAAGGAGGGYSGSVIGSGSAGKAIELNSGSAPTWVSGSAAPNRYGAVS